MERQIIPLESTSFYNEVDKDCGNEIICTWLDCKGFKVIQKIQKTFYDDDSNTIRFVVQRMSDKLFFKGEYEKWPGDGELDYAYLQLSQVFPVEKMVIVYE